MTKILKTDDLPVLIDDPLPVFVRFPTGELVPLVRAGAARVVGNGRGGEYWTTSADAEDEYGLPVGAPCWVLDAAYSPAETEDRDGPLSPVVWLPWDGAHRLSELGDRAVTVEGSLGQSWTGRASEYASHPLVPKNPIRWAEAQTAPPFVQVGPDEGPIRVPVSTSRAGRYAPPLHVIPYVGWADWNGGWPEGVPDDAILVIHRGGGAPPSWHWEGGRAAWNRYPEAAPDGSTWCVKSWGPE